MTLEERLNVLAVEEALQLYMEQFPGHRLTKFQLADKGPYYKYAIVGTDGNHQNSYEFNAHNGNVIKEKTKPLSEKKRDPSRLDAKTLNVDQLLPLTDINAIALDQVPLNLPFQWELDAKNGRTYWKVEVTNAASEGVYEVKVDAQEGTVLETKLKS